nr:hypothetical protein Itr_chr11CG14440 [Ipomoea trifida]
MSDQYQYVCLSSTARVFVHCNCLIVYEYLQQPSFCVLLIGSFCTFSSISFKMCTNSCSSQYTKEYT